MEPRRAPISAARQPWRARQGAPRPPPGGGAAESPYTDTARDGTETGPNLSGTAAVAAAAGLPLLASGGVGSLEDLRRLAGIPGGVGAVVGRGLYTGAGDLKQGLAGRR